MAVWFNAATGQDLNGAVHPLFPSSGYTFWVAAWVNPGILDATRCAFAFGNNTTNGQDYVSFLTTNAGNLTLSSAAGGTATNINLAIANANGWLFFLYRSISSVLRQVQGFSTLAGAHATSQSLVSSAPSGINTISIGSRRTSTIASLSNGAVAELYYGLGTPFGINATSAYLPVPLLRDLAYKGPFAFPELTRNMLEYRSFRKIMTVADGDTDYYFGNNKPGTPLTVAGANSGYPHIGPHCPLPASYVRPEWKPRILGI